MYASIYIYMYVCLYMCMRIYMDVYICVCACACVCVYIYMYMYVCIYIYVSLYHVHVQFVSFNIWGVEDGGVQLAYESACCLAGGLFLTEGKIIVLSVSSLFLTRV